MIALNDSQSALDLIPKGTDDIAVKAVASLARYVDASDSPQAEAALEELRDLAVEIESEDFEGNDRDKALVRVLAATAFARAGEVEEALETLNTETEDLEAWVSFRGGYRRLFLLRRNSASRCLCRFIFPSTDPTSLKGNSNVPSVGPRMIYSCSLSNP